MTSQTDLASARLLTELNTRQREILFWLTRGYDNAQIATLTHLSRQGVKNLVMQISRIFGVRGRLAVVVFAQEHPLLTEVLRNEFSNRQPASGAARRRT